MSIKSLNDIAAIKAYLERIGAEPRSLKSAVVKEDHGEYWTDKAIIRFQRDGAIIAPTGFEPTDAERVQIAEGISSASWPTPMKIADLSGNEPWKGAPKEDVFVFRDESNMITMVQVRTQRKKRNGELDKAYIPWTYWSDGDWRSCEPDGLLPLFNLERIGGNAIAVIHEGAKAARHAQWLVDAKTRDAKDALAAHPWGEYFEHAVHLGWIGGALNPTRTDWSPIKKAGIIHVYIVADNDRPGRNAVPIIAESLRVPTSLVQFREEFPPGFDLADAFPKNMFREISGQKFYTGPAFLDCEHPATWATDLVTIDGKSKAVLRESFVGQWVYCEGADLFINRYRPELQRTEAALNRALAPFSHTKDTAQLIAKSFDGRHVELCYRPDLQGAMVTAEGTSAINLHVKCRIRSKVGDVSPFIRFLEYLVPSKTEQRHLQRWLATLIARPAVRMGYGMLMISEKQGIGKTTLAEKILAPLVGPWNVSFPSEADLTSQFNEWCACKRLVVVSEIYSGSSWKVYNGLKSIITDGKVTVNVKYQRQYKVDNWVHIFACSNSKRALKIQDEDRRWFRPELTEISWPSEKFIELRKWIDSGGLQIIKHWAENFQDYVGAHEQAPMTASKQEMIEASRSEAQQEAIALADALMEQAEPSALAMKDVQAWCANHQDGRMHETDYELRKAMMIVGVTTLEKRVSIAQRKQHVLLNAAMADLLKNINDPKEVRTLVLKHLRSCSSLMPTEEPL